MPIFEIPFVMRLGGVIKMEGEDYDDAAAKAETELNEEGYEEHVEWMGTETPETEEDAAEILKNRKLAAEAAGAEAGQGQEDDPVAQSDRAPVS